MPAKRDEVTVQHLVNSIYQIQLWCDAVREVLECLPPEMCIPLCEKRTEVVWNDGNTIRRVTGCPPPENIRRVVGCPPPQTIRRVIGCPPPQAIRRVVGCPPPLSSPRRKKK